ncbi:hypothetical protein SERLA73DRAFT_175718 [Serpula lacrymans var. lacrymans S7.3]|uniref:Uncharacterized protein n=2 Tax=Serpula lacrymans var. lacrymans TaxID=341189 RepID=F8PL92_SERL3|nr:uncharacterized protein SERLADRAFT_458288 [Serpula lacrymans var. lacrymans S7.9]EGO04000.1 hypothetical protein SERLA73DRAFT_175718 [Serpula lacrymans var. lacrymans S7.3]EGO29919.1 hypothetical protein SERLADRAFT_458288 [Serpula lacrymans var. lacrymans S7.9]
MALPPASFTVGSLYLAGFAQARAPHAGLIIPSRTSSGRLVHIRIDRETSPTWAYQSRAQKIEGDMFFSTLLKLRDVSAGSITVAQLEEAAMSVPAPDNDEFGECLPWVLQVVQTLHDMDLIVLTDIKDLGKEFEEFATGNKAYATRTKFPNVKASQFCT